MFRSRVSSHGDLCLVVGRGGDVGWVQLGGGNEGSTLRIVAKIKIGDRPNFGQNWGGGGLPG